MLKHLPRPLWDETFSSWVHRASRGRSPYGQMLRLSAYALEVDQERLFVSSDFYTEEMPRFLPDFDFDDSKLSELVRDLSNMSRNSFRRFFGEEQGGVVPWDYRRLYCPACLERDIQQVGYPSWKKSWCYGTSAYCVEHGNFLQLLRVQNLEFGRAWDAFKYHAAYSEPLPPSRGWFSAHGAAYRNRLAKRVQVWVQSLTRKEQLPLPGTDTLASSVPVSAAVHASYSILLRQRTRFSSGGYAKTLARRHRCEVSALNKTLPVRLKLGVYESTPYERMCALLLVGIIFGVINASESARLDELARAADSRWPTNVKRIGQQAIDFKNLEEYALIRGLFREADAPVMKHIADFIDGMETSALSIRELRSATVASGRSGRPLWERWLTVP